jgi:hypothetical protein
LDYSEDVMNVLREIADAGGTLEGDEGKFDEAMRFGLVTVSGVSGGWGYTDLATITNRGRRVVGLPVMTPETNVSLWARLRQFLGATRPEAQDRT